MATEVARPTGRLTSWMHGLSSFVAGIGPFLSDVRSEMKKVTWPDRKQLFELTRVVIIFVFIIAVLIWLLDTILQAILVQGIPRLFR